MNDLLTRDDLLLLEKTLWNTDMTLEEALDVAGFEVEDLSEELLEELTERLKDMGVFYCDDLGCWVSRYGDS